MGQRVLTEIDASGEQRWGTAECGRHDEDHRDGYEVTELRLKQPSLGRLLEERDNNPNDPRYPKDHECTLEKDPYRERNASVAECDDKSDQPQQRQP
jgi:hypothetical protein